MGYGKYIGASSILLLTLMVGCSGNNTDSVLPSSSVSISEEEETASKTEELLAGTISRHPETGTEFMSSWQNSRSIDEILTPDELGCLDLRCADLSGANLSHMGDLLQDAAFDDKTTWPDKMPANPNLKELEELGKDPGLGIRDLHAQGITGKGVGIAIIDQTLLADHQEYADRLRLYQEYHTAAQDPAQMHGAAVASIALGKNVGVAPDALLYYIADDVGTGTEENFIRDVSYYADDIDKLIAFNKTLPEGEKIRVISMSIGYLSDTKGAKEMDAAISRAREAGMAVVWVSDRDSLMKNFTGMGRKPFGDPNSLEDCTPGRYLLDFILSGEYQGVESVLIPMDRRTTAAQTGPAGYAYYPNGGASWKTPYVAGLYALACQVKPDVTFEEFTKAALETAHPVSFSQDGADYPYGKVVDPAALLEAIENE